MSAYTPRGVRLLMPLLVAAPTLAALCLAFVLWVGRDQMPWAISFGFCVVLASGSWLLYGRSILKREGPAR